MARPAISKRELLDYVRCEEIDEVSERLKLSSFLYVGFATIDSERVYFWSYPSLGEVCWVALTEGDVLSTVDASEVPSEIAARAAPLEEHPIRPAQVSNNLVDRGQISKPMWVPFGRAPRLFYFPMYELSCQFSRVEAAFSAKSKRLDGGDGFWHLFFCVKLTSGRYAMIQCKEANPSSVSIELEVDESEEEWPLGYVYVSDLKEILSVIDTECVYPLLKCQYEWRE